MKWRCVCIRVCVSAPGEHDVVVGVVDGWAPRFYIAPSLYFVRLFPVPPLLSRPRSAIAYALRINYLAYSFPLLVESLPSERVPFSFFSLSFFLFFFFSPLAPASRTALPPRRPSPFIDLDTLGLRSDGKDFCLGV